jgi:hypothetical protein
MFVQSPLRRSVLLQAAQLAAGLLPLLPYCLLAFLATLSQLGHQSAVLLQALLLGSAQQT